MTTIKDYYDQCLRAGYDPHGTYTAHSGYYHSMVGTMLQGQWHTGKVKGLFRACLNAKAMAVVKDLLSKGLDKGVVFWINKIED